MTIFDVFSAFVNANRRTRKSALQTIAEDVEFEIINENEIEYENF